MITLYGIRHCDSVKKARKALEKAGVAYRFVDFDETAPDEALVSEWASSVGVDRLFNTRSKTYRDLGLKEKRLDDDEKIAWMARENRLIKRPVLVKDGVVTVGFDVAYYDKLIK